MSTDEAQRNPEAQRFIELSMLLERVFSTRQQIFERLVSGELFPSDDNPEEGPTDIYRYEMGADNDLRDPVLRIRFGGSHQRNPYVEIREDGAKYCESFTPLYVYVDGVDTANPSDIVPEEAERAIACLQALVAE
jgi:hypothetical protein